MTGHKVGDRIIAKREDGLYDIHEISDQRTVVHDGVQTLDDARRAARDGLPQGGQVWYRDHRDTPGHLEPL